MSRIQPTRRLRMPRATRSTVPTEHQEAVALMDLVRAHESRYPALKRLFHVPNGGLRNKVTSAKLKAEGVRPGVPDYIFPVRVGWMEYGDKYHGLAIELKRKKSSKMSDEQADWINWFDDNGWRAVVCKGHAHAWAVICEYLSIPNCLERGV